MIRYTNRLKLGIPEIGDDGWGGELERWADTFEVIGSQLLRKNYVISGLAPTFTGGTLNFQYTGGTVEVGGAVFVVSGSSGLVTVDSDNWLYVQNGVVILSNSVPIGDYVVLAYIRAGDSAIDILSDLRPSYPRLTGIDIAPIGVNPTGNVALATSKRIIQTDEYGSNYFLFLPINVSTVVTKTAQTAAIAWTSINLNTLVPGNTRFAVLTCHVQCNQCPVNVAFASLHVRGDVDTDEDQFYTIAFGRGVSEGFYNASGKGASIQFVVPVSGASKQIWYKTTAGGLGSGTFSAYIDLVGYIE